MSVPNSSNFCFNCTGRKFSSVCVESKLCRPKWRAGDEESIASEAGSEELHVSAAHTQDALPIWINVISPLPPKKYFLLLDVLLMNRYDQN
jgi:hypothetical protein